METVEMDLMQAQIAELTTEVTRLQRSAGGAEIVVDLDPIHETASMSSDEILAEVKKGKKVIARVILHDFDEPGDWAATYFDLVFIQYIPSIEDVTQRCLATFTSLQQEPAASVVIVDGAKNLTVTEYQLEYNA